MLQPIPHHEFRQKHSGTIQLPAFWHDQPHPAKPEENLPALGYGTYVLEVLVAPEPLDKTFALSSSYQSGAGTWRITNLAAADILGHAHQGVVASNS